MAWSDAARAASLAARRARARSHAKSNAIGPRPGHSLGVFKLFARIDAMKAARKAIKRTAYHHGIRRKSKRVVRYDRTDW